MKISKITIYESNESDLIILETNIPSMIYPFDVFHCLRTTVGRGMGMDFVKSNFKKVRNIVIKKAYTKESTND